MRNSVRRVARGARGRAELSLWPGLALLALLAHLALLATPALANLRAPVVIPESPSAALAAPGAGLTATRERLRFSCGPTSCRVTAVYEVTAVAPVRVRLQFVLPVEGPVTATTNDRPDAVDVVPAHPLSPAEASTLPRDERGAPRLFRAAFSSALEEGANTVAVEYTQPLGAEETDYGYFKKHGRMVHRFRYELWPLREWARSPGFRVTLAVAIEREAPGLLTRWFGTSRSVTCLTSDPSTPVPPGRREQRGGELWYEAELGPSIPDRITCYVGDDDLMPRH
jgi:hypothetical protein